MKKTHKAIKYRIYPTKEQQKKIVQTFGCVRFVYNYMLGRSKEAFMDGKRFCSRNQFNYLLTDLKKENSWLKEVDSTALTSANDALAAAFSSFFEKRTGYPTFRKKKLTGSYTTKKIQTCNNIMLCNKTIRLPKLGKVKAKVHRHPKEYWRIKSATVSQTVDGKFYVAVLFEFEVSPETASVSMNNAIGLDYASDGLYVDSNGNTGSNHKYFRESQQKLAKAQQKLSRKIGCHKGETKSKNYLKQFKKVGKIYRHIANQRQDNLHKLSTEIANRYDIVCVETLNMKALANKGFGNGKATMDNGYGMFLTFLAYKLQDRNKQFVKVDKWYPSSQLCSCCGHQNSELKDLRIRSWDCPECGAHHQRDGNAAVNILHEGLRLLETAA